MSGEPERADWRPIDMAPPEVDEIAHYAPPPGLGQHIGRCYTLPDGRWVVISFSNPGGEPASYFVLPAPPQKLKEAGRLKPFPKDLKERHEERLKTQQAVDRILYGTIDPTVSLSGKPVPAMTTLIHRVCDGDGEKFEEAIRIVELFIGKAINDSATLSDKR